MSKFGNAMVIAFTFGSIWVSSPAFAQCTVPNVLTNGQVADASEVMDNFNAIAGCAEDAADAADVAVVPTGTPQAGKIAVFAGAKSITSADLSGDVTTAGGTTTTLSPTAVTPGSHTNANITVDQKRRMSFNIL